MDKQLEARIAARTAGYTYEQFCALPGAMCWKTPDDVDSQAEVIALYRITRALDEMDRTTE